MARLVDVIEQLKENNQTNVDINAGIAGLENMFGAYFANEARRKLEEGREKGSNTAAAAQARGGKKSGGGGIMSGLGSFLGGKGLGAILGGAGIGIGAAGAGVGAFFMGLAGAEAIMQKFGGGDNLKKLLINLGEGLEGLGGNGLKAIGAVLATGAIFGALGKGFSAGAGIALMGAGIAGFFTALAASDKAMEMMDSGGGKNISAFLKNFGEALGSLSNEGLVKLGGLMAGGGALAALFGVGKAAKAAVGITAIGAGIAGFFTALGVGDKLTQLLNVDGSAITTMMKNVAEALNAFSPDSLKALGAFMGTGAALGLFGAPLAGMASIGMTLIGAGVAGFFGALAGVGDLFNKMGVTGGGLKVIMKNMAEALGELGKLDSNIGDKVSALSGVGPAMLKFFGSAGLGAITDSIMEGATKVINFLFGTNMEANQDKRRKGQIAAIVDSLSPLKDLDVQMIKSLDLMGNALVNFGKSFESLQNLRVTNFKRSIQNIASSLASSYDLLNVMANGGKAGSGYFDGMKEVDFGPKGSGGILNPNLNIDKLVETVEKVNFVLGKTTVKPGSVEPPTLSSGSGVSGGGTGGNVSVNTGGNVDASDRSVKVGGTTLMNKGPGVDTADPYLVAAGIM